MKATPLYDRVILRRIDATHTKSGLVVPAVAHEGAPVGRGEVIACGPGMFRDGKLCPMTVQPGDVVWYAKPAFQPIPFSGEAHGTVGMLREPDIMAVLTELERDTGLLGNDGRPALVPVA